MVAAAGEQGTLRPAVGVACLVGVLVLFIAAIFMTKHANMMRYVSMDKHPEALAERARQIIADLGLRSEAEYNAYGYDRGRNYMRYIEMQDDSPDRWEVLRKARPPVITFWYRQDSRPLVPWAPWAPRTKATLFDPPQLSMESVNLVLTMDGDLLWLQAIPPFWRDPQEEEAEVDWSNLFSVAGLDPDLFEPIQLDRNPLYFCDTQEAWKGVYPERPEIPMWIRACAYRGTPIHFQAYGPWLETQEKWVEVAKRERPLMRLLYDWIWIVLPLGIGGVAVVLVIRNLRLGRGDRRGALRVAAVITACQLLSWLISPDHVANKWELYRFLDFLAYSLMWGALAWAFYMALEPFIRRYWPSALVSWSRLLSGRGRDPLVGRDILVGMLLGFCYRMLAFTDNMMSEWIGIAPPEIGFGYPGDSFLNLGRMTSYFLGEMVDILLLVMGMLLGLALARALLRRRWLAIALVTVVLIPTFSTGFNEPLPLSVALHVLIIALIMLCMLRFGLLAMFASGLTAFCTMGFPLTPDMSAWYASATIYSGVVILALAVYGFIISLPRKRLGTAAS
jgi:hypothetical protein